MSLKRAISMTSGREYPEGYARGGFRGGEQHRTKIGSRSQSVARSTNDICFFEVPVGDNLEIGGDRDLPVMVTWILHLP